MAALSLMPIWVFMYVRSLTEAPEVDRPARRSAPRSTATARAATAARARAESAGRSPTARSSRRSRTSRTSCASSTSAPRSTTRRRRDLRQPGPRGRCAHHRVVRADAGAGHERRRRPHRRRDPRRRVPRALRASAAPTRQRTRTAEEFEDWCSEESPMFAALEAGTPLADLDDAGITGRRRRTDRDHRHRRRSRRGPLPWRRPTRASATRPLRWMVHEVGMPGHTESSRA